MPSTSNRLRTGTRACLKSSAATCSACSSMGQAITRPSTSIGIPSKPNHRPSMRRSPQAQRRPWDSSLAQIDPKHRQQVSQNGAHIGRRLNRHASCVSRLSLKFFPSDQPALPALLSDAFRKPRDVMIFSRACNDLPHQHREGRCISGPMRRMGKVHGWMVQPEKTPQKGNLQS